MPDSSKWWIWQPSSPAKHYVVVYRDSYGSVNIDMLPKISAYTDAQIYLQKFTKNLLRSLPYGFWAQLKILFSLSHLQNVLYFPKKMCNLSFLWDKERRKYLYCFNNASHQSNKSFYKGEKRWRQCGERCIQWTFLLRALITIPVKLATHLLQNNLS